MAARSPRSLRDRCAAFLGRLRRPRATPGRPGNLSRNPLEPHNFEDAYADNPFGLVSAGNMTFVDELEGRKDRCVLCGKLEDDLIHAPAD